MEQDSGPINIDLSALRLNPWRYDGDGNSETLASGKASMTQENIVESMKSFLVDNDVFEWLLLRIKTFIKLSRGDGLKQVSIGLFRGIKKNLEEGLAPTAHFVVDWNLIGFLEDNYGTTPNLAKIIAVNSDAGSVQAITVGEYISQTWPLTGPSLLQALALCTSSDERVYTQTFKGTANPMFTGIEDNDLTDSNKGLFLMLGLRCR